LKYTSPCTGKGLSAPGQEQPTPRGSKPLALRCSARKSGAQVWGLKDGRSTKGHQHHASYREGDSDDSEHCDPLVKQPCREYEDEDVTGLTQRRRDRGVREFHPSQPEEHGKVCAQERAGNQIGPTMRGHDGTGDRPPFGMNPGEHQENEDPGGQTDFRDPQQRRTVQ